MGRREQTVKEERANSLSHIAGILGSIIFLVSFQQISGDPLITSGGIIFGYSLLIMYTVSSFYHALPPGRGKRNFRILDHSAIFVLIAGTYTPFMLGIFEGTYRWAIMIILWSLALGGVLFKIFGGVGKKRVSVILYILMGWISVVVAKPIWEAMYPDSIFWLLGGGVFYTGGVLFYTTEKLRYNHFYWHLCVLAGSALHVVAVVRFITTS